MRLAVAGIQCSLAWEDAPANRRAFAPRIADAARRGARLVIVPEMWPSGFSMRPERVAETEGGPSERLLAESAAATGAAVGGSIAQIPAAGGRPRNVFVLAMPAGSVHRYAKVHPFSFGGESKCYDAGDALVTIDVDGVGVTPLICYDLRFPEMWAAAAGGTDLFVVVANWPRPRAAHWRALLVARAIETQAYVLGVNRIGEGGGLVYDGESALVSPLGDLIDGFGAAGEERVVAGEVDPARVAEVRAKFPFLADRRPGVYRRMRGEE